MDNLRGNSMPRGEITALTKANDKSYSLRTTVPKGIVSQFDLKEGGFLNWEIKPSQDGKELVILVSSISKSIEVSKRNGKKAKK